MCDVNGLRIITSYRCNYNCSFCYQKDHSLNLKEELTVSALSNRIALLRNSGFKPIYITFMGGEFTILEKSFEYIDTVNKIFPFSQKSVTTNGSATVDYYEKLKLYGINNITFSINHLSSELQSKIEYLRECCAFTIRANIYLNFNDYGKMHTLLEFCMRNGLMVTFCADIKSDVPSTNNIIKLLDLHSDWTTTEYSNHTEFRNEEYPFVFWVFHHRGNYKNDNWIILPSGGLTCNFNNVIDCRGSRKEL